jgi:hypothetical protein
VPHPFDVWKDPFRDAAREVARHHQEMMAAKLFPFERPPWLDSASLHRPRKALTSFVSIRHSIVPSSSFFCLTEMQA